RAYAAKRPGVVSFAVRTRGRAWSHRGTRGVPAASTLKAILLVAYLRRPRVRTRALTHADRRLLAPMVRRSDNVTATRVRDLLGNARLTRFARRAGMRRFRAHPVWGLSRVDAADLSRFMLHVDELTPPRHRAYAMHLLRTIVPSQRWGVAQAKPPTWQLFFKGGWGSGTGAVDHQVALLTNGDRRVSLAITTTANGSHAAGKRTLEGVARRLLRGLPE
ncbi:MAG: class A beta-lactamase-related serine hydrolase, partial [Actinomycetota bacterium]|nr:class A beta-lactamase-related serine hydrolase [Actinomycetota bacterium]